VSSRAAQPGLIRLLPGDPAAGPIRARRHSRHIINLISSRRSTGVLPQSQVDLVESGRVEIREGNGRKDRVCWLPHSALPALRDWQAVRAQLPGPLLLPVRKGGNIEDRALSAHAVPDLCRELARLAAEPFTPHDLRPTWTGNPATPAATSRSYSGWPAPPARRRRRATTADPRPRAGAPPSGFRQALRSPLPIGREGHGVVQTRIEAAIQRSEWPELATPWSRKGGMLLDELSKGRPHGPVAPGPDLPLPGCLERGLGIPDRVHQGTAAFGEPHDSARLVVLVELQLDVPPPLKVGKLRRRPPFLIGECQSYQRP
jgi:hypothetical protein